MLKQIRNIMKREVLVAILSLVSVVNVFAQEINQLDSNDLKQGEWVEYKADTIHGDISIVSHFKDDLLNGAYRIFSKANVLYEVNYVDGKKNGVEVYYDKKNRVFQMSYYYGGVLKEELLFYRNGVIKSLVSYDNGVKNGLTRSFYSNGKTSLVQNYVNDNLDGEELYYRKNGIISLVIVYKDNEIIESYKPD